MEIIIKDNYSEGTSQQVVQLESHNLIGVSYSNGHIHITTDEPLDKEDSRLVKLGQLIPTVVIEYSITIIPKPIDRFRVSILL